MEEEIKEKLKKYGQEHVLAFYNELTEGQKRKLEEQVKKIDFSLLDELFRNKEEKMKEETIEPISYETRSKLEQKEKELYTQIGKQSIQSGKVAVCQMAGGQGTRLGHNGPKGTYMVPLAIPKSIFQIFAEKLQEINKEYSVWIPWYIMTSDENNEETIDFFEKNKYFNYPKEKVSFFRQGKLAMLDTQGRVILNKKYEIKEAADGNGGIFEALYRNNILEKMKEEDIQWLGIGNVDNILLNLVDPLWIGMAESRKVLLSTKTVTKVNPTEKVGVVCKIGGKPGVIEYTEISEQMANLCDENGQLVYGQSYFGCALYNINLLEKIGAKKLPYHPAFKKCDYIAENGELVTAETANAYKFESFIFDSFKFTDEVLFLNVKREEEFAPIKNKIGADSPETAKKLYEAFKKKLENLN